MIKQRGEAELTFVLIIMAALGIVVGLFLLWPQYNVYAQRLSGEAALAHAHAARQVIVQQAQAEKDSAVLRAEAIAIVGKAAHDFPEYRNQEFIGAFAEAMHNGKINHIIYVPTEANIPILEAGKRK
jgi:regulator of protease activity HflC (stomatin/prohibitin superfamily)